MEPRDASYWYYKAEAVHAQMQRLDPQSYEHRLLSNRYELYFKRFLELSQPEKRNGTIRRA